MPEITQTGSKGKKQKPLYEDVGLQLIDSYLGDWVRQLFRLIGKKNAEKMMPLLKLLRYAGDAISVGVARVTKSSAIVDNIRTRGIGAIKIIAREIESGKFDWEKRGGEERRDERTGTGEKAGAEEKNLIAGFHLLIFSVPPSERPALLEAIRDLDEPERKLVRKAFDTLPRGDLKGFVSQLFGKWHRSKGRANPEDWQAIFQLLQEITEVDAIEVSVADDAEMKGTLDIIFSLKPLEIRKQIISFLASLTSSDDRNRALMYMAGWKPGMFRELAALSDEDKKTVLGITEPMNLSGLGEKAKSLLERLKSFHDGLEERRAENAQKADELEKRNSELFEQAMSFSLTQ